MSGVLAWALPIGAALDAVLGDPRGRPHPVRAIGALIVGMETIARRVVSLTSRRPWIERAAGVMLALVVVGVTAVSAWAIADRLRSSGTGRFPGRTLVVNLLGTGGAQPGPRGDGCGGGPGPVGRARALALIVGRDTETLDRPEVCRACVETVAENCNDPVVAPLFWFALMGPVGLWAYKAVSTLDSMVGYRNERYVHLGWASARLDDLAAFLPARLTWLLIAFASLCAGEQAGAAFRIGWRDGRKHPSPNAGWGEAAMAERAPEFSSVARPHMRACRASSPSSATPGRQSTRRPSDAQSG